ncbi:MAG: hypothetical protein ACPLPW_08815 [bacterium]
MLKNWIFLLFFLSGLLFLSIVPGEILSASPLPAQKLADNASSLVYDAENNRLLFFLYNGNLNKRNQGFLYSYSIKERVLSLLYSEEFKLGNCIKVFWAPNKSKVLFAVEDVKPGLDGVYEGFRYFIFDLLTKNLVPYPEGIEFWGWYGKDVVFRSAYGEEMFVLINRGLAWKPEKYPIPKQYSTEWARIWGDDLLWQEHSPIKEQWWTLNLRTGKLDKIMNLPNNLAGIEVSPDGRTMIIDAMGNPEQVWIWTKGETPKVLFKGDYRINGLTWVDSFSFMFLNPRHSNIFPQKYWSELWYCSFYNNFVKLTKIGELDQNLGLAHSPQLSKDRTFMWCLGEDGQVAEVKLPQIPLSSYTSFNYRLCFLVGLGVVVFGVCVFFIWRREKRKLLSHLQKQ